MQEETKRITDVHEKSLRKHTGSFRKLFVENIWIKLTALFLTLVLFYLVKQEKDKEIEIDMPVSITAIEDDMVFVGKVPPSIRVRIKGRWSKLVKVIESKPLSYNIDLKGYQDGTIYIFDREKAESLIGGIQERIQILSIFPGDFMIRKEEKVQKVFPVEVSIVGVPKEGYEIDRENIKWTPKSITLSGAKTSFGEINIIWTHPIDVNGLDKHLRIEVGIQKPAKILIPEDIKVKVEIPIKEKITEKILSDVGVKIKNCPENFYCYAEPEKMIVKIKGPQPFIDSLSHENINKYVYIDANIKEIDAKSKKFYWTNLVITEMEKTKWKVNPKKFKLIISEEEKRQNNEEKKETK